MDSPTLQKVQSYGLASSQDLITLQQEANDAAARTRQQSLKDLTYATAVADAHEALVGLTADLSGTTERHSLKDMLLHENRMRGLGILLVVLALVGLCVDYIMLHTS